MQKTYWDNLGQDYQFYSTPTLEFIASFIYNHNLDFVFEASCGTGYFIKLLRHISFSGNYLGSDYCNSFLKSAKANNPKENYCKANLYEEIDIQSNVFDVSVVHHGMDYVYPYRTALKELKRISKEYVIITLWQSFNDKNRIGFTEEHDWQVNQYARAEWYDELKAAGYKIVVDAEINEWNEKYGKYVYNHLFILKA